MNSTKTVKSLTLRWSALGVLVVAAAMMLGCSGAAERAGSGSLESQKPAPKTATADLATRSQSVPQGFESYKDPQGNGQLFYRQTSGGRAFARPNMREFLDSLRSYFDGPITVIAATSDSRDTVVHALFSTRLAGKPVQGLAVVVVGQDGSTTGLIYGSPSEVRGSYARLSAYFAKMLSERESGAPSVGVHEAAPHAGDAFAQINAAWDQEIGSAADALTTQASVMHACQKQRVDCRAVPVEELIPTQ